MYRSLIILSLPLIFIACSKENSSPEETPVDNPVQPVDTSHTNTVTSYYTGNIDSLPKFVRISYMEFDSIGRVSTFRSGVGHDFSDDFEFCRSMKHYFEPRNFHIANVNINIYNPFRTTVERIIQEWAGSQIYLVSTEYPFLTARIFHVNLNAGINTGDTLSEGFLLGTHIGNMTSSDIAITVLTPTDGPKDSTNSQSGIRFASYFSIMTDSLFQRFSMRGLNMDSVIISAEKRDSFPLNCNNGAFSDPGTINNWITLQ